jgi:hypothetical protein
MKMAVKVLDVWRQESSRRIVVKAPGFGNLFCLVSPGTGEQSAPMSAADVFGHLVLGKNGSRRPFLYEFNMRDELEARLPSFGPYACSIVAVEDVSDPMWMALRDEMIEAVAAHDRREGDK